MDSNRKTKLDRGITPVNLNVTEYNFKSSAKKRFSPNLSRKPLNETICSRTNHTADPKIKSKLSTVYAVNYKTECDIAYNDYLQALLKRQLVKKKVLQQKQILEEQVVMQSENLYKRNQNYEEIINITKQIENQSEIVEMIDFLQTNLTRLKNAYANHEFKLQANNFKEVLISETDKLVLKNVKSFENQEEYDKFMNTVKMTLTVVDKIINSGRKFQGIHTLAENMETLINLKNTSQKLQQLVLKLESDGLYSFLQNTSDLFAKKYNDLLD